MSRTHEGRSRARSSAGLVLAGASLLTVCAWGGAAEGASSSSNVGSTGASTAGRVYGRSLLGSFTYRSGQFNRAVRSSRFSTSARRSVSTVPRRTSSYGARPLGSASALSVRSPSASTGGAARAVHIMPRSSYSMRAQSHAVVKSTPPGETAGESSTSVADASSRPSTDLIYIVLPGLRPLNPEPRVRRVAGARPAGQRPDYAYYIEQGREAFAAADYRAASGHFLNAGFKRRSSPTPRAYYAACQFARADFLTAGRFLHRLVLTKAGSPDAVVDIQALYPERELFLRHLTSLQEDVDRNGRSFMPVFLLAYLYQSMGRADLAAKYFKRAMALRPRDRAARAFVKRRGTLVRGASHNDARL